MKKFTGGYIPEMRREVIRKIFFEIHQGRLVAFIRIPDFTNFPAITGFLVMVIKELQFNMPGKRGRE